MEPYRSVATARRAFYVVTAARWLPTGLVIPTIVLFLTSRGLTLTEAALTFSVQALVVLLLELPTGGLADALGRRPVLALGAVLSVASSALMLGAHSFTAFAVAWGLKGVFRALDSGPLEAWYVDIALDAEPGRHIEADLAGSSAVLYAAVAAGSLLAGLGTLFPDPLTAAVVMALGLECVHLLAILLLVRETRAGRGLRVAWRAAAQAPRVVREAAAYAWRRRALRLVLAVELSWGAGLTAVELLWQPRLATALGSSENTLALGLTGASAWIAGAAGAGLLPLLIRWLGGTTVRTAGLLRLAQAVAVLGLAVSGGVAGVVTAYVAFYVVHGASNPAHAALLHRMVTGAHRTTVLSVNSLVSRAGGLPAGVVFGALADSGRTSPALLLAAVLLALGMPLYRAAGEPGVTGPKHPGHGAETGPD